MTVAAPPPNGLPADATWTGVTVAASALALAAANCLRRSALSALSFMASVWLMSVPSASFVARVSCRRLTLALASARWEPLGERSM